MRHGSTPLPMLFTAARAVGRRPDLWATALGSYRSLVPRRWWRQRPFLPLPDRDWLRFRLVTAYGGDGSTIGPDGSGFRPEDLIHWLEWLREFPDR